MPNLTPDDLINAFKRYYGPYENGFKESVVRNYIDEWSAQLCGSMFDVITRHVPSQYKTPPDINTLETHKPEALQKMALVPTKALQLTESTEEMLSQEKALAEIDKIMARLAMKGRVG